MHCWDWTVLMCLSTDLSVSTMCSASVYQSVVYHSVALCTAVLVFTAMLRWLYTDDSVHNSQTSGALSSSFSLCCRRSSVPERMQVISHAVWTWSFQIVLLKVCRQTVPSFTTSNVCDYEQERLAVFRHNQYCCVNCSCVSYGINSTDTHTRV